MALPMSNVRDIMRAGANLAADREKPVRLVVAVESDAPDAVLAVLEEALKPRTRGVEVAVGVVGDASMTAAGADAVVVVLGSGGARVAEFLAAIRASSVPVVTLLLEGAGSASPEAVRQPLDDFLSATDAETLVRKNLGEWLADRLRLKRLALAAGFDFMRASVSAEFVKSTAWQNALIGGIVVIPGADMPLMTGNQAKMVLQIAAAYGEDLDTERAKELLAVVGGGLMFRAVARQLLDFVPGFGWALKAGVGYTGTMAMGKAAIAYFDQGADLGGVVRKLRDGVSDVADRARSMREAASAALPSVPAGAPYKVESSHADTPGV
jgi:uncharacterized protein (DUF697 family)